MNCGGCSYGGCDDDGDEVQVLVIRTQVIRFRDNYTILYYAYYI